MMDHKPVAVSFFSGCGGLDLGFKQAGYKIAVANDNWRWAAESHKLNYPETSFILKDIRQVSATDIWNLLKEKGISNVDVVIGGPPCQCFSRLNNNNLEKKDERRELFLEYIRLVKTVSPKAVVMENVADILVRKNEDGMLFKDLIGEAFKKAGYEVSCKVLNAEEYGVPQIRRRAIFLAGNVKDRELTFPEPSNKKAVAGQFLKDVKKCANLENHEFAETARRVEVRMKHIPPGGYYENLPRHLKTKKFREGKWVIVKRYGSYYRRLHNDRPSVTITDNPLIHPDEDRYLTNREMAILHTFPKDYKFAGFKGAVSQQIANAVPPALAFKIAEHLRKNYLRI